MNKKSLKELKQLILLDIENSKEIIDNEFFNSSDNPQVKDMYIKSLTRVEAMETVLQYINTGSKSLFSKPTENN